MLLRTGDVGLDRPEPAPHDRLERDVYAGQTQRPDSRTNRLAIDTGVDEGGERHVARDSRGTLQVDHPHVRLLSPANSF